MLEKTHKKTARTRTHAARAWSKERVHRGSIEYKPQGFCKTKRVRIEREQVTAEQVVRVGSMIAEGKAARERMTE